MFRKQTQTVITRAALMLIAAATLVGVMGTLNTGTAEGSSQSSCTVQFRGQWWGGFTTYGTCERHRQLLADGYFTFHGLQNAHPITDIQGNPISSDEPNPGWHYNYNPLTKDEHPLATSFQGDRIYGAYCVNVATGRETDAPCISGPPTQVQNIVPRNQDCIPHCDLVTQMRWGYQDATTTKTRTVSSGTGTVIYQADENNRVVSDYGIYDYREWVNWEYSETQGRSLNVLRKSWATSGNVYYREWFLDGVWYRSVYYGVDEDAKQRAIWSAWYVSQGKNPGPAGTGLPPALGDPPPALPTSLGNPPTPTSTFGGPGTNSPSNQNSPPSGSSVDETSCDDMYNHLPPHQRDLVCAEV